MDLIQIEGVAVIADVVKSRSLPDRSRAQKTLEDALDRVNSRVPAIQPLAPSVGDEVQGMYENLSAAVTATLHLRLEIGDTVDCRFGIGSGWYGTIASGATGIIQDGSAWWSARTAIDEAKRREAGRTGNLRTWFEADEASTLPGAVSPAAALVNAYLLARDQLVGSMDGRSRRLLLGTLLGTPQRELADRENISQSAVSHNLRRNGAFAVIEGAALLDQEKTT